MAASTYHVISREAENCFFRHNSVFRHTCLRNQPKLTKKWYYIYFVQILYSHLRYTDRLLNFFFLLLAVILSELHKNSRRKDWVTEKVYRRICVRNITFLAACSPSYIIFCRFFLLIRFYVEKKNSRENGKVAGTHPQCLRPWKVLGGVPPHEFETITLRRKFDI